LLLISFQDGSPIAVPEPSGPPKAVRLISLPGAATAALTQVRVKGLSAAEPEVMERLRLLAAGDARALRLPLAAAAVGDRLVLLAEAPGGPSLRTVLRLVPLTWEQAAVLGEWLLAALSQLQAQQLVHGEITSASAVLCPDGRVRLIDPAPMPPSDPAAGTADDGRHASRLLSELLEVVSGPSRRSISEDLQLAMLQVASDMASEGTRAAQGLASWRRVLRPRLGRQARARVVRQLEALATRLPGGVASAAVEAVGPELAPTMAAAAANTAATVAPQAVPASLAPTPAQVHHPEPQRPSVQPESPRNRRRVGAAAGIVVALLAVGGGTLLATRGGPQAVRHHPAPSSLESPSPPATPTPIPSPSATATTAASPSPAQTPGQLRAIPALAPASTLPVERVQLEAGCTTSGTQVCQVTLTISLGQHAPLTVAWEVEEVDRCDGAVTTVASGQIPAPASYTYVQTQPQVSLPPGLPVALVGLAGAPGQAASLPLSITPPGAHCPG